LARGRRRCQLAGTAPPSGASPPSGDDGRRPSEEPTDERKTLRHKVSEIGNLLFFEDEMEENSRLGNSIEESEGKKRFLSLLPFYFDFTIIRQSMVTATEQEWASRF
jgi:hypothetical protein